MNLPAFDAAPMTWLLLLVTIAVSVDPQYASPLEGTDAIGKYIAEFFKAFPDLKLRVVSTIEQGSSYAAEIVMSGTHKGALLTPTGEVPPTNRRFEIGACLVGRLDKEGRISEEHRYFDLARMMSQLGVTA
jgi:steroid delta-isomerase-like uncharacterized protein